MSKKRKNNKTTKIIIAVVALTLIVGLCVGLLIFADDCKKSQYNKNYEYDGVSLVGKWMDEELDEKSYDVYEFVDSSKVILSTYCYGIELDSLVGTYEVVDKNQIKIHSEFGYEYIRFSITKKNKLVLVTLDDMNRGESERVMTKYDLNYNSGENKLLGSWQYADAEKVLGYTFNNDYTGNMHTEESGEIRDYKIYYSIKGDKLYYIREFDIGLQDMVRISSFELENASLFLGSGESKIEFKKQ